MAQAQQLMLPPAERIMEQPTGFDLFVSTMKQDQAGMLWLGAASGLIRYDGRQFRQFDLPAHQQDDNYAQLAPDNRGRVWLRYTYGEDQTRLAYFEPHQQKLVLMSDTARLIRDFLNKNGVRSLLVDKRDRLWIGRKQTGLLCVDLSTQAIESFLLPETTVISLAEGPDGTLWAGTDTGLYAVAPATRQIRSYPNLTSSIRIDKDNPIMAMLVRPNGELLLGLHNRLVVLSPRLEKVREVLLPLPTPTSRMWTNRLVNDSQGNTYFSVGAMVCRLTPQNELQRLEFAYPAEKIISIHVSKGQRLGEDRLWVNAGRRLAVYDLSRLRPVPAFNLLDVTINGTRLITAEHHREERFRRDTTGQPSLFLKEGDFVSLWFLPTAELKASRYRYKLDGYDQQWTDYHDTYGGATYQLPAGTYTFLLNRAKPSGGWEHQPARLWVLVEPPFWKTPWFISLVLLIVGGGVAWVIRNRNRRRKLREELDRQAFEAKTLRELDKLKSRFFANVTHEFRTPLTIIINATEQLAESSLTNSDQKRLNSIERNTHQLLRLINEALDFAKLDASKLDKCPQIGDPLVFVEQVVAEFQDLATSRQISLSWVANASERKLQQSLYQFDGEKLEKITYNLLANALKFTLPEGTIRVEGAIDKESCLLLRVTDTGIGIPADQLLRIFERFHQVDNSPTRAYTGTGIGLALVKELTEWLGGQVVVNSQVGQGSTFTVTLPLQPTNAQPSLTDKPLRPVLSLSGPEQTNSDKDSLPTVLVVEDDLELRSYIRMHLTRNYQIITADNGRIGVEQAIAQVPDLIVSDVMMPELDGYQLAERLKADERTSHIPLILLTAKSAYESRMKGLNSGADDYLSKPFSLAELRLRIGNCLHTRQRWQQWLQPDHSLDVPESYLIPRLAKEEHFLNRLRSLILTHLTDEVIEVDWLADQMNMSRTQLHRKLKALTNMSTTRFIHSIRIQKAVELLQQGELNVAQVAQTVGYNSQSYFTKIFHEQLGYVPVSLKPSV